MYAIRSYYASADNDEQKEHEVQVNSFLIAKFEVTVWEWKQFV